MADGKGVWRSGTKKGASDRKVMMLTSVTEHMTEKIGERRKRENGGKKKTKESGVTVDAVREREWCV